MELIEVHEMALVRLLLFYNHLSINLINQSGTMVESWRRDLT